MTAPGAAERPTGPPEAPRKPFEHTAHMVQGVTRPDPFAWMRDLSSEALLAHLRAERAWYDAATAHLDSLVDSLTAEMVGRLPTPDRSVSWRLKDRWYYTLRPAGSEFGQLMRELDLSSAGSVRIPSDAGASGDGIRRATGHRTWGEPELLLDLDQLAEGSGYLELGLCLVSPDGDLLAYSFDRTGDEVYTLRFRDLRTGHDLPDEVPRSYYGGAWSAASDQLLYTVHDDASRPYQVRRHVLGTPVTDDVVVVEEPDERFELNVRGTRSGDLVVVRSGSRTTTEVWVVDAHRPERPARSVGGRRDGVTYDVEHARLDDGSDTLLVVTDDGAPEFRLVAAPVPRAAEQDHTAWRPVLPERSGERLERVDCLGGHAVLGLRTGFETVLRIVPLDTVLSWPSYRDATDAAVTVRPSVAAGCVEVGPNAEYEVPAVTVVEQSYVRPPVAYDVDLGTGRRTERERVRAPGHEPAAYRCERHDAAGADGTVVPVTLVRHRDTPLDGTAPALLFAYGAYEYSFPPAWDPALPSLLDRGVVFAHTHVRGGGEGGRRWWLDGRLGRKQHTFDDLVAAADSLDGLVDGRRIATRGLSAGGLLQAVVFSQRPERWCGVVAEVPFVDVVTTMSDPTIPLTVTEWDEWGDPRRPEQLAWMLAYSPYDNLPPAGVRPDLLVTGALHDPRVLVHEPAKWVAALRASDPAWSPRCLFRVETGAGAHTGPAGRRAHLRYEAEVQAWLLERFGLV
jgi:oligopeptidase B